MVHYKYCEKKHEYFFFHLKELHIKTEKKISNYKKSVLICTNCYTYLPIIVLTVTIYTKTLKKQGNLSKYIEWNSQTLLKHFMQYMKVPLFVSPSKDWATLQLIKQCLDFSKPWQKYQNSTISWILKKREHQHQDFIVKTTYLHLNLYGWLSCWLIHNN